MKCPYCQREMTEGYLRNPRGVIAWTPMGMKANVLQSKAKDYQVKLGEMTPTGVTTVPTYYCKDCGIFLMKH